MNRVNAHVAVKLFERKLLAEPVAAENLQALRTGQNTHFRGIGFGDRRQKFQKQVVVFMLFAFGDMLQVFVNAALEQQSQRPFHNRLSGTAACV